MSSTVKSKGFIAVLKNPISEEERDDFAEKLYDEESTLDITYDGSFVFSDIYRHESMSEREDIYQLNIGAHVDDVEVFKAAVKRYNLEVVDGTIMPYNCIWYNGTDCPVSELTPETYLAMI